MNDNDDGFVRLNLYPLHSGLRKALDGDAATLVWILLNVMPSRLSSAVLDIANDPNAVAMANDQEEEMGPLSRFIWASDNKSLLQNRGASLPGNALHRQYSEMLTLAIMLLDGEQIAILDDWITTMESAS